jgi:hypothetical protein
MCIRAQKIIDISWLDWVFKSSTCDVMYRRKRRHLYYGGQIKNYYLAPSTAALPWRAALASNSNRTRSVYSRENPKISLYCEMSMIFIRITNNLIGTKHNAEIRTYNDFYIGDQQIISFSGLQIASLAKYIICWSTPPQKKKIYIYISIQYKIIPLYGLCLLLLTFF